MFRWFENRVAPFPQDGVDAPPKDILAFCWYYVRHAKTVLFVMSGLSALVAVGEVALFGFLGQFVDWLANGDPETFLADNAYALIAMSLVVLVLLPGAALISSLITHQSLLGNLPMSSRWRMHQLLLRQSLSFFNDEFAGRVATKVMQTSLAVRETVMKLLDILVYIAVYFITMLIIIGAADLRLVAPLIIWLALYIGIIAWCVPRLRAASEKQADARSAMTGRIVDSYTNITTVKLFSHAGREAAYARESMGGFLTTVHKQMRLVTIFSTLIYTNNCLVVFSIAALSLWLWSIGAVSLGAIAVAIGLALRINGMSQWIMWEVSALFENIGVIIDGRGMLTREVSVVDQPKAQDLQVKAGVISFEGVSFHYGKKGGVIDDLTLRIAAGEKIGLVGRSGAGKTTLTNLLLRFYDLESGRIAIDDEDISTVTQESVRAAIGVVTQDTALLHRSIRDNICYGRPDADEAMVREAIKRANAEGFIADLVDQKERNGLDAHVGERGVKLSGGQRQRIAIARIFLKDAPILILDEATSALDSEVEAAIQDNLFSLMEGKTVIAIAHRLSTIAEMDRLIVLDAGKIVEEGNHESLLNAGGLYAELWARQSGGFLGGAAKRTATAAE
ncbi:MAG: ABC transporter ATP-binding protein [Pseudomonadota bacterium]